MRDHASRDAVVCVVCQPAGYLDCPKPDRDSKSTQSTLLVRNLRDTRRSRIPDCHLEFSGGYAVVPFDCWFDIIFRGTVPELSVIPSKCSFHVL